jgi:uncharacterized protein (UPF0335 family)
MVVGYKSPGTRIIVRMRKKNKKKQKEEEIKVHILYVVPCAPPFSF